MTQSAEDLDELLRRCPLPMAVLIRRAYLAKSARQMHDYAFWAWDVAVRLRAMQDEAALRALGEASLGAWISAQRWPTERIYEDEALYAVVALFAKEVGRVPPPGALSLARIVEWMAAYRNAVIGHSSPRPESFYERAGRALLAGVEVACSRNLFWPAGARLIFVDPQGGAISLMGCTPMPVLTPAAASQAGVVLQSEEGTRCLHPWLLYDATAPRDRVLVFNGSVRSGVSYLDFDAGDTIRGAALRAIAGEVPNPLSDRGGSIPDSAPESGIPDVTILGPLGGGEGAGVELARRDGTGRLVALKRLRGEPGGDGDSRAQVAREIEALLKCEHQNIVRVLSSGQDANGAPYYTMELIEGASLSVVREGLCRGKSLSESVFAAWEMRRESVQCLKDFTSDPVAPNPGPGGEAGWEVLVEAFAQAAEALAYLRSQEVLHRGINPGSILVSARDMRVIIVDFSLARFHDPAAPASSRAPWLGDQCVAPERRRGERGDWRSDIYSLAATFRFFFFVGREPESPAIPALHVHPAVVRGLRRVLDKALEAEPRKRYQTAASLAGDIRAILSGRRPRLERSYVKIASGSIAFILAAAIGVLAVQSPHRQPVAVTPSSASASAPIPRYVQDWAQSDLCEAEWKRNNLEAARHACLEGLASPTPSTEPSLRFNLGRVEESARDLEAAREQFALSLWLRPHPAVLAAAERVCTSVLGPRPAGAALHLVRWKPRRPRDLAVVRAAPRFDGAERDELSVGTCVWVTGPTAGGGLWAPLRYPTPGNPTELRDGYMHVDLLAPRDLGASGGDQRGASCGGVCCGGSLCTPTSANRRVCGSGTERCAACPSGATCVPGDCADRMPAGVYRLRVADVFDDHDRRLVDVARYETALVCFARGDRPKSEACVSLARTRSEAFGVPIPLEATPEELAHGGVLITLKESVGAEERASWGAHNRSWGILTRRSLCEGHVVTLDRGPLRPTKVRVFLEQVDERPAKR